jgi:hypothetical protein
MSDGRSGPWRHTHGMGGGQVGDHTLWMDWPGGSHGVTPVGGHSAGPGHHTCLMGEHESHDVTPVGWEGHGWASRPSDSDGRAWGIRGVAPMGWKGPQSGVTPVGWEGVTWCRSRGVGGATAKCCAWLMRGGHGGLGCCASGGGSCLVLCPFNSGVGWDWLRIGRRARQRAPLIVVGWERCERVKQLHWLKKIKLTIT